MSPDGPPSLVSVNVSYIADESFQSSKINFLLSPKDRLNLYWPKLESRWMQDKAISMRAGMYSKDRLGKGLLSPVKASSSAPSMSILQKSGMPNSAISISRVVVSTLISLFQITFEKRSCCDISIVQSNLSEDIVGFFVLI